MAIALTSNASDFVSSGETAACTLATIHAGDIVVVHAMVQNGTATGISDSAGVLTFGAARTSVLSGSTTLYEYVAKASAAASGDTITLSTSATDTIWICASAWSGLASSGWFDPNGSLPATSGSGAATFSTSNADDLLIVQVAANGPAPGVGSGWTSLLPGGSGANYYWQAEYQIVSAVQSSVTPTITGTTASAGISDALKQASAAPAAHPFRRQRTYLGR